MLWLVACLFDVSNPHFDGAGGSGDSAAVVAEEACSAGLIHLNGEVFASIQDAADVALDDAVIELCPGEFRENLDFRGPVTLRRMPGADGEVLLVGTQRASVIRAREGGTFEELVITEGQGYKTDNGRFGGGLYTAGDTEVTDVVFRDNTADYAAGFYAPEGDTATLTNVTFTSNVADTLGGGAVFAFGSSVTLVDCLFDGNRATFGGGFGTYGDTTTQMQGTTFEGNNASSAGGAMSLHTATVVVSDGAFSGSFPQDVALTYDTDSTDMDVPGTDFTCVAREVGELGCE